MSRSHLLVIGEAAALAWVLAEQRMAFPALRRAQAARLEIGDELLVYTTRNCFHNPPRDRGRVMGEARVTTSVHELAEPVIFGEREYTWGCALDILGVTPLHEGVELNQIVPALHIFPDARSWSARLRRALVNLDEHDAMLLKEMLIPLLKPLDECLDAYLQAGRKRMSSVPTASG